MNSAMKCKVKYHISILRGANLTSYDYECERYAVEDGYCICHLDDPHKKLAPIMAEVNKMFDKNEFFDCCGFIFPKDELTFNSTFKNPTFFENCIFYGDVSFNGSAFHSYTSFYKAQFRGKADFGAGNDYLNKYTKFLDDVKFNSAIFNELTKFTYCSFEAPPDFQAAKFYKGVNFAKAKFDFAPTNEELEFRQTEFMGRSNLDSSFKQNIKNLAFRYCNLEGLEISSLPRKSVNIIFEDTTKWNTQKRWYQFPRHKIFDEESLKNRPIELNDTYRFLENNFYRSSDYSMASQFHVGQMVSRLKDVNYGAFPKILNYLYRWTSNYGESLLRPLVYLALIWMIIPVVLLFSGIKIHQLIDGKPDVITVNYDLTAPQNTMGSDFLSDYYSAFWANLSLSTIDRNNELKPDADSFQRGITIFETGLIVMFISLLIIASRRKFTPKKPTGT